ncbi:MAG: arginine--tRNA ligase [Methanomassiliicoccus sp.]|nr:arginine--tRNA ligase [Methanomassiliicoccus sp.]
MDPLEPFQEQIRNAVQHTFAAMGGDVAFEIEVPSTGVADFAVPCFPLAKVFRKAPPLIAEEAASKLPPMDLIARAWAEKGYLNFKLDDRRLNIATMGAVMDMRADYGRGNAGGVKVLLEHTSVNPTGPIHVGRARNPIIGDTLARCMRAYGYDVTTEYYVNDVGKQVVLLTWGLENIPSGEIEEVERDKADHRLVLYYQKANRMMEEDPQVSKQVGQMLRRFEDGDEEVMVKVRRTAKLMLDGIIESLTSINVIIDQFTWESEFIKDGTAHRVVEQLKRSEHCSVEEGACYLELKSFGIHGKETRFFFTRADGTTLYTTRDMAYHLDKFDRADRLINILGEDQKLGQTQLAIALKLLGKERAPECVFYSFVSLPEGRMSTRRGTVVYLDDLIEEAEERALEEVRKRRTDLSEEKMMEIARAIGRGAVRYNIVRVQPEKPLVFKWEDALNFEGNSAPFVQYAHARACSIQRKAGQPAGAFDPAVLTNEYELRLIRVLARYPSVIKEAGEKERIQALPAYGHELAASFNQFYTYVPVLKGEENRDARLALVDATRVVLANVLTTLGLSAPEEM